MMNIQIKQFSSLEKIFSETDLNRPTIESSVILPGEHFSYQVAIADIGGNIDDRCIFRVKVNSPIAEHVKLYSVKSMPADFPHNHKADSDYLVHEPTLIPDLLVPIEEQKGYANLVNQIAVFWVEVCLPRDFKPCKTNINLQIEAMKIDKEINTLPKGIALETSLEVEILPMSLPEQKTIFTQWFHVDCIASVHNVSIYSEEHWNLIDKYMAMASGLGINMLLTPVITPPLDTAPGIMRPNVQLVKIQKNGEKYAFDFSFLRKYIALAKKNGIKYFEISHFFSQWGCHYSPNITACENGEEKLLFGWHVPADDPSYSRFLKCLIPELLKVLEEENVKEASFFHLSDEPSERHLESYEYASKLLSPLLGECKIIDALSNLAFYEKGLVEHPVCSTASIEPFLEKGAEGLWVYYCCSEVSEVSNRFMAMPSQRNRIIGLQLYKYGIEGFLHWGYNFYYSQYSLYEIDPYVTTSADGVYSSGDPFSVYPGKNGPLPSIRAFVFREALEDIEILKLLEQKIGKKAVIELIEKEAGMEITFKQYPRNAEFITGLMNKIKMLINN